MKLSAKVLVIGGGPAGSTAARILAAEGTDVILIEKNTSFAKPCGGGLAMSAFAESGIPHTLITNEVNTLRLISPSENRVDIPLNEHSLAIVERAAFDSTLRQRAEERGAEILEGEFMHVTRQRLNRSAVIVQGLRHDIISEFIVAADGVNSRARTALGIKPVRSLFTASAILPLPYSACCEFWFGSSHASHSYAWVFPAGSGCTIGTGASRQGEIVGLFEKFRQRKGIEAPVKRRIYRIPLWTGDLYNIGNVLFAGDAAGQVMPLTYEGIYYAMKAGELAAESILEGTVHNYRKRWKQRFEKRFMLMEKLRNYFLKDDASAEKLVQLHMRPDIQAASLRLWIGKDSQKESLRDYVRIFRKFL